MINFINLTNGIEAIPHLPDGWQVVRIQSTTIEKENWERLFLDLDHNFLFRLSQGEECVVYDFGTRHPISKTISVGVPLIKKVLQYAWLGSEDVLHVCQQRIFVRAITEIAQEAKRKINYYRKILNTQEVKLRGVSQETQHDGDWSFYRKLLS